MWGRAISTSSMVGGTSSTKTLTRPTSLGGTKGQGGNRLELLEVVVESLVVSRKITLGSNTRLTTCSILEKLNLLASLYGIVCGVINVVINRLLDEANWIENCSEIKQKIITKATLYPWERSLLQEQTELEAATSMLEPVVGEAVLLTVELYDAGVTHRKKRCRHERSA